MRSRKGGSFFKLLPNLPSFWSDEYQVGSIWTVRAGGFSESLWMMERCSKL